LSGRYQKKCFQGGKGALLPPNFGKRLFSTDRKKGGRGFLSPPKYLTRKKTKKRKRFFSIISFSFSEKRNFLFFKFLVVEMFRRSFYQANLNV
jgi:hypothetical protein